MRIKKGSNRLVIILKNKVIKIPLSTLGLYANKNEYLNYIHSSSQQYIAKTQLKKDFFVIQEKLNNCIIYPYGIQKEHLKQELWPLFDIAVHNRFQVGQDKDGNYKIFDYEEVKWILWYLGWIK